MHANAAQSMHIGITAASYYRIQLQQQPQQPQQRLYKSVCIATCEPRNTARYN